MAEWHVTEDLFGRFLSSAVSREEAQRIIRHLVSPCQPCSELASRMTSEVGRSSQQRQAYEAVFARALAFASQQEERLALEKLRGWAQWASLESSPPPARLARVEADERYHTHGFYERLLEASRWYIRTDPNEAVDVIRLAIRVAEHLDTAAIGAEHVADLRAAAWAALGNAERLASSFEAARRAFDEAWRILEEEGTNDPVERAHLIGLESGYTQDMGEFEAAEAALEEALDIYHKLGDTHLHGRTLLKMGDCIGQIDPERGIARILQALPLLAGAKEPRLDLCAQHDLAWFLNDNGQSEEALAILDRARPIYRQFPDSWTQLRLHWLEGRIAVNLGDLSAGESIFGQLWEELRVRDLHHELVLVSIDLAEVLVRKGEPNRAAALVEQCVPILQAWGLHRYALAAWLAFQEALEQGWVLGVFDRMREYYRRHWVKPAVFEPEG